MRNLRTTALVCLLTAATSAVAEATSYILVELATPSGCTSACSYALNDFCQSVGAASGLDTAVQWTGDGTVTSIGLTTAHDINNSGLVVGSAPDSVLPSHSVAAIWQNGSLTHIHSRDGSVAQATNALGQVLVYVDGKAYIRNLDGTTADLGNLGGWTYPYDINDQGQVVGYSNGKPFFWTAVDGMQNLGLFGGLSAPATQAAQGINNLSQVVGGGDMPSGPNHAITWQAGTATDLGTLGRFSTAYKTNDAGQVVGYAENASGELRAVLWAGGNIVDLNDFVEPGRGWVLNQALDINRWGDIVGYGTHGGQEQAFLLKTERTVTAISSVPNPTNSFQIAVTVTFSVSTSEFDPSDIQTTNAALSCFTGSGTGYSFTLAPSGQGDVSATIAAGTVTDVTGSTFPQCVFSRNFDSIAPTVTLGSGAANDVNASITVSVSLSEEVTDFSEADIQTTNATVSGFAGSGASYSFVLNPIALGAFSCSVAAGACHDAAENDNTVSNTLTRNYDSVVPSVILTSAQTDPTNVSPIVVTATFSEAVAGLVADGIAASHGTVTNLHGSGTTYTFDLIPSGLGLASVRIDAGSAHDAAGNGNTVSNTLSRTYNNVRPTVAMESACLEPTNTSPVPVTVTFSALVTGFSAQDIQTTNGSVSGFGGSGATYTFLLTPEGQGEVTASIPADAARDAADNANTPGSFRRVFDSIAPTVALASVSAPVTNALPIHVEATFSEPVTGLTAEDIAVSGADLTNLTGSGSAYSFDLVPTDGDITVLATVSLNAAQDAAGNGNTVSNTLTRTYDATPPNAPIVNGTEATDSRRPTWSWGSGGGSGSGSYRYRLDNPDLSGGTMATATLFTPETDLSEGVHILYVQERDVAGNWSSPGNFTTSVILQVTVSGHITDSGVGLAGVVLAGFPSNVMTEADGAYVATVPFGWSGTVSPSLAGYVLSPVSRTYSALRTNQNAQDYSAACGSVSAPGTVQATDGSHSDRVRVTWSVVAGAVEYEVHRGLTADSLQASLLATVDGAATSYDDLSAVTPTASETAGCNPGGNGGTQYQYYYYWVKAKSVCGESELSGGDRGHRGKASTKSVARIFETVLPSALADDGFTRITEPDSRLSVRVKAAEGIDPLSVQGAVTTASGSAGSILWIPIASSDGWAVYEPTVPWQEGDRVTMTVTASTTTGKAIGPIAYSFVVRAAHADAEPELPQPSGDGIVSSVLEAEASRNETLPIHEVSADAVPPLAGAIGQAYRIGKDEVCLSPQRLWIPVPDGVPVESVRPYYLHEGANAGWYDAAKVEGWLVQEPTTTVELEGMTYLGLLVQHSGVVQLAMDTKETEAGVLPLNTGASRAVGDLLLLGLTLVGLSVHRFRNAGGRVSPFHGWGPKRK